MSRSPRRTLRHPGNKSGRAFDALSVPRPRRAAIPVLAAIVVLVAAQSAAAATSLTGEALSGGTATSTGGSTSGSCPNRSSERGTVGFKVGSGTATGPYVGSFAEGGTFSVSGYRNPPWRVRFTASFTITSRGTTITGSFATPPNTWWSVGFICNSSGGVAGYSVSGRTNYTATITGRTYQGTASVSGTFYKTVGAHDSVGETVLVSYGQIAGAVTDSASKAPLAGVCVQAYTNSGSGVGSAQTNASGVYTLANVPEGPTRVGFSSGCGASNYLAEYYNGQPSLATAASVTVTAGATTAGINAAMVSGGQITGTVTSAAAGTAIAGICVQAYSGTGAVAAFTQTSASGAYTLNPLPTGAYSVGFLDCNGYGYVAEYYNGKATLATGNSVTVTAGATTSGINAAIAAEGRISGAVTDKTTQEVLAGFCVDVYDASGNVTASASTDATGAYTTPALPSGSYRLSFFSCDGSYTYPMQYYNGKATLSAADPVIVKNGATTAGVNAALVSGGQITGIVTDSVTHAPVAGICALALDSNGNNVIMASTDATGAYTIPDLQTGPYRVEFYSQCGTMNYVTQYYNGKATLASADPVSVTVGSTISGIDAKMAHGGEITGTATDRTTGAAIWGLCVDAFDTNGNDVAAGYTDRTGAYTIYGAPPGAARVEFYSQPLAFSDPSCGGTNYLTQYYAGEPSLAAANPVTVTPGATTPAINAVMTAG
jgi:hypothetical protein